MTYEMIQDYMIRTYGFENDSTVAIFALIEVKALTPAELWALIEDLEDEGYQG